MFKQRRYRRAYYILCNYSDEKYDKTLNVKRMLKIIVSSEKFSCLGGNRLTTRVYIVLLVFQIATCIFLPKSGKSDSPVETGTMDVGDLCRVNKIVDKRLKNNAEEYLIRWDDYTSDYDSWEKEENCINCYSLILKFEMNEFESRSERENSNILELKKDIKNRIKLLVEWDVTKTQQFFYSSVIICHNPHILINFYEKNVYMADRDDELIPFHNSLSKSEEIVENAQPHKIIAVANNCNGEKLYLLSFRNVEEASIVDDAFIKMKCPTLLVKFYEKHLLT